MFWLVCLAGQFFDMNLSDIPEEVLERYRRRIYFVKPTPPPTSFEPTKSDFDKFTLDSPSTENQVAIAETETVTPHLNTETSFPVTIINTATTLPTPTDEVAFAEFDHKQSVSTSKESSNAVMKWAPVLFTPVIIIGIIFFYRHSTRTAPADKGDDEAQPFLASKHETSDDSS